MRCGQKLEERESNSGMSGIGVSLAEAKARAKVLDCGTVGAYPEISRKVKRERVWLTNYRHNEGPDSPGTLQRLLTSFLVRQGPLQGLEHRPGLVLPTF